MVAAFWKIWEKKNFNLMLVLMQPEENMHNVEWLLLFC